MLLTWFGSLLGVSRDTQSCDGSLHPRASFAPSRVCARKPHSSDNILCPGSGFAPSRVYTLTHMLAMAASTLVRDRGWVQAGLDPSKCAHSHQQPAP